MKIQLSKTQWEHIGRIAGWIEKDAVIFEKPNDRIQKGKDLVNRGPDSYIQYLNSKIDTGEGVSEEHRAMIVSKNFRQTILMLKELLGSEWDLSPKAKEWDAKLQELSKPHIQAI